jgi:hypothetical protein
MRLADAKAIADAGKKAKYSVPELETALHRLRYAQGRLPRKWQKAWKRSEGRIGGLETELATRRDGGSHNGGAETTVASQATDLVGLVFPSKR